MGTSTHTLRELTSDKKFETCGAGCLVNLLANEDLIPNFYETAYGCEE